MSIQERTCPACGRPASAEQRSCSGCGTPLPPNADEPPEPPPAAPEPSTPPVAVPPATPPAIAGAQGSGPPASSPPPPPPGGPPPTAAGGGDAGGGGEPVGLPSQAGFLQSLFDLSFTQFVTPKIVKVLYVLSMIGIGLTYLAFVVSAFNYNSGFGLLTLLVLGPLLSLFYLAWVRVLMEIAIVFFRIHESTADIAHVVRGGRSPAA